jgi:cellulose synthase/poly-beta-1,6-N-acetylglucosamine synthase-like glycosyltransferase/spore germination protein YaaH/peptidoglycan/xylan/chitin deacetylase (PgdA/CDA1 family)
VPSAPAALASAAPGAVGEVTGFHVNWDDNSLDAVRAHAARLDVLIAEWAFVPPAGDGIRWRVDRRVTDHLATLPAAERPALVAMLTNVDTATARFDPRRAHALVGTPAARARTVRRLADGVRRYALAGICVDLENLDDATRDALPAFVRALRAELAPLGATVSQTVAAEAPASELRAAGREADRVIVMLYDEHYGGGDPGPVASAAWYEASARRAATLVPRGKLVLAIGTYGYDWHDAQARGEAAEARTFAEVMRGVREGRGGRVRWDANARTPVATWTDPDSTDHVAWFLDATSAHDQQRIAATIGARGVALWRLGAEDPAVWSVIGDAEGAAAPARTLASVGTGYDVEFDGTGELLKVLATPHDGARIVDADAAGRITDVAWRTLPRPWSIARTGAAAPRRVALTFDDGPDSRWTPAILDTLRTRGVTATFFVVGLQVVTEIPLTRRIVAEGHELGNHSFTHPDLSRLPDALVRLELGATERAIEAVTNRRSALFRPPYFGDAAPTTIDALRPIAIAGGLGYVTAGLQVDSDDWVRPGADEIVRRVLARRAQGQVVLLHDAGGERAQTLAAIGPMIDSLRARGDTIVPLSALLGLTPDQAMPALPPSSRVARWAELAAFGAVGATLVAIRWLFIVAVALGAARLLVMLALAAWHHRRTARRTTPPDPAFAPAVTVVVPAYNERTVIARTIESLLAQRYAGPLEVLVVDDGSPDGTGDVVAQAFGGDARVTLVRQPNGGKASALDNGIARATGEIVVCLDADTLFEPDTVAALVAPFRHRTIGAVAGNAKVGNRINIVTRWQALEYVTSQNVDRRAFDVLGCITVVPGAVGAWRREAVRAAGGFTHDTLAEDQDLTIALLRRGWRVTYAERAIAWTEAPDTLGALAKQRFRWSFGTLQCAWKHRDTLFRRRFGALGLVAMPNTWLFQLVLTALSPLADLLLVTSLVAVGVTWVQHGATYAIPAVAQLAALAGAFLALDWAAATVAFRMEPGEEKRLAWLIALQRFAYRQVMYWVVLRAFVAATRGRLVGWGTLERKGTVAPAGGERAATAMAVPVAAPSIPVPDLVDLRVPPGPVVRPERAPVARRTAGDSTGGDGPGEAAAVATVSPTRDVA